MCMGWCSLAEGHGLRKPVRVNFARRCTIYHFIDGIELNSESPAPLRCLPYNRVIDRGFQAEGRLRHRMGPEGDSAKVGNCSLSREAYQRSVHGATCAPLAW